MTCSTASAKCVGCACGSQKGKSAVPLPSKRSSENTALLWATTPAASYGGASAASPSSSSSEHECPTLADGVQTEGHASDPAFVCCRNITASDTRTLIDPDFARDCIVGLSDGLTVPFALTAGLSSVGSSKLVVLAGLAELVSGAISMGIGGFLSAQAELSHYAYNEKLTQERVQRSCKSEIQRQVQDILKSYGIEQETCAKVALELSDREVERRDSQLASKINTSRSVVDKHRKLFGFLPLPGASAMDQESQTLLEATEDKEMLGLTPFLLRVGEGLEPVSTSRLYISALTIGLSYFLGGIVPLLPYIFIAQVGRALTYSVIITGVILLVFGVVKQRFTGGEGGFRGYAYGAVSTLMVGGVAAGASWLIVGFLEGGSEGGI